MVTATPLSRRALGAGALAAGAALATGCDGGGGEPRPGGTGIRHVTFLTAFGTQGRDAYAFVAAEKGYFTEAGLHVTIQPGKAGDYNHQQLAGGKAQFAAVDASGAFIRYANGRDTSFQILAAVHQSTLVGIIALAGEGIARPQDLVGRTLGTVKGSVVETLFPAYAKQAGFDAAAVRWRYGAPEQMNALLAAGAIDGAGLFVVGTPGVEAAARRKAVVLPFSDYLADLYGAVVVAQKSTLARDAALAKRFTSALLRGLDYSVRNPAEAGAILARKVGQNAKVAAAELERMRPYVLPPADLPVGFLGEQKVVRMVAALAAHGLVPQTSNPGLARQIVRFDLSPSSITGADDQ